MQFNLILYNSNIVSNKIVTRLKIIESFVINY